MAVVVVGVHERDFPLQIFERVAVSEPELPKALAELIGSPNLSETVILSTCLRTEVYAVLDRFHDGVADIESFFRRRMEIAGASQGPGASPNSGARTSVRLAGGAPSTSRANQLEGSERRPEPGGGELEIGGGLSCRYDDAAVAYLFEVAAGIDSPVLGEGEILRQVRQAFAAARSEGTTGGVLGALFRHAVEAGKRARTETAIQRGTTSLADAAVELAAYRAGGFEGKCLLLIGAGDMGAGMARALAGRRDLTGEIVVANRGADRAADLARTLGARVVGLEQVGYELARADVVLTSTAADNVIIGPEMVGAALDGRGERRVVVLVDLAIPRDVDPSVDSFEGVVRLDVEDVRRYAEARMAEREGEVPAVRGILSEELDRYHATVAGRLAVPVLAALRNKAELLRSGELDRYRARLRDLSPEQLDLVDTVTRRVVAKLLHSPTVRLKEAAGSPRGERLADALQSLFDL
ncbi:MAG: glutamyl-tRNA reductase [Actinomycetota bacterium]|nr:glutamyl-tRNA reductase [Actinomycetota bacterium]